MKLRLFLSVKTRVLGAQKNHFADMVVLSTHNIYFGRVIGKNNSLLRTLICGTDELPSLTCVSHVLFISLGSLGD